MVLDLDSKILILIPNPNLPVWFFLVISVHCSLIPNPVFIHFYIPTYCLVRIPSYCLNTNYCLIVIIPNHCWVRYFDIPSCYLAACFWVPNDLVPDKLKGSPNHYLLRNPKATTHCFQMKTYPNKINNYTSFPIHYGFYSSSVLRNTSFFPMRNANLMAIVISYQPPILHSFLFCYLTLKNPNHIGESSPILSCCWMDID